MNASNGRTVAIATEAFEVHLADDGSSALAVYPLDVAAEPEFKKLIEILTAMGFSAIHEYGWREVKNSESGLTGDLEWDLLLAGEEPRSFCSAYEA
jgi:hypothetical protein